MQRLSEVPRLDLEKTDNAEVNHLEDNGLVTELSTAKVETLPGIDNLPSPVPTSQDERVILPRKLPCRPASEANINYISADSGELLLIQ